MRGGNTDSIIGKIRIMVSIAVLLVTAASAQDENNDISCYHCHSIEVNEFQQSIHTGANNVFITGGKIHEEQSVYLLSIDAKRLVTYFYIIMILFELTFTIGLIFLGITSNFEIRRRH